ncbi:phosphatase domain-containing protein [Geodermatophilus sp. SYSU D00708]
MPAPVHVASPDANRGVVCDLDDTVWITGIRHPLRAAWRTFMGNGSTRRPVAGMAALANRLVEGAPHAPVYLDNGPWNLAGPITQFLERHSFPRGAVLTDWGISPGVCSAVARRTSAGPWTGWPGSRPASAGSWSGGDGDTTPRCTASSPRNGWPRSRCGPSELLGDGVSPRTLTRCAVEETSTPSGDSWGSAVDRSSRHVPGPCTEPARPVTPRGRTHMLRQHAPIAHSQRPVRR